LGKEIIKLLNIEKIYSNGLKVVDDFNLSINKSEFITLLGPSGCGKTTVLKMLAGFEEPTKGNIFYKNISIKNTSIYDRPTATVFQDYALFPNMNVYQNIQYGLKIMRTNRQEIKPEIYKKSDKILRTSQKKANIKIKFYKKSLRSIEKDLSKTEMIFNNKPELLKIKNWTLNEYINKIEQIEQKMHKKLGDSFNSKQPFSNNIKKKLNTILLKWKINYIFENSKKGMNEFELKIDALTHLFYKKNTLIKKIENLNYKKNEIEYDISYWENYPTSRQEKFIKKNITRRLTSKEIDEKINNILKLIGLEGKEDLLPKELSGGMQQRVALARAIIIEPEILLLDEPLSALDAKVRRQMQKEMKKLHHELGITFILVTHDQEEALLLSDKVVVMNEGKIQQIGTPNEIYDTPVNKWVANFIGSANFFNATITKDLKAEFLDQKFSFDKIYKVKENEKKIAMIRNEDFDIVAKDKGFINATVISKNYKGVFWDVKCKYKDITISVEGIDEVKLGKKIGLKWDLIDVHLINE